MAALISDLAQKRVDDPAMRRLIQTQSRQCFAQRGLTILSDYRTSGGKIGTIVSFLWRFRQRLGGVSARSVLRFVAIVLCPRPIVDILRQRRHGVPESLT
jgi:hypothetical protein